MSYNLNIECEGSNKESTIRNYLIKYFQSDVLTVKYWMVLLSIDDSTDKNDQAAIIVDTLFNDVEGFGKIINVILDSWFESEIDKN